ncbi:hypothetical protein SDC9_76802 [bioreactor metagenome]|uniref:DUF4367 domain-containing protein n=1 Tax=bioreactor metagenome TaxID=1076179 RepID=A0A644YW56_9ZZZZ
MNKQKIRTTLQQTAEALAPASKIDLWPALKAKISLSRSRQMEGLKMKKNFSPKWAFKPTYAITLAVIFVVAVFALPQGRAFAQQIWHFFSQGDSNMMPGITPSTRDWVEQTPGVAAETVTPEALPAITEMTFAGDCGASNEAQCSVDQIRAKVDFSVLALPQIPAGMAFVGANGKPGLVTLTYMPYDQRSSLVIQEEAFDPAAAPLAAQVGADAEIKQVKVGDLDGEYVKGSYNGNYDVPVWDSSIDLQTVRWVQGETLITVYLAGAADSMGMEDLINLSASLTEKAVGLAGQPDKVFAAQNNTDSVDFAQLYPLSFNEAETVAGFKLLSPSELPANFSFVGASVDLNTKVVKLLYNYQDASNPDAQFNLIIRELANPNGEDCILCGFVQGSWEMFSQYPEGKLISSDANLETVQVGSSIGQYVQGIGWVSKTDGVWQWDSSAFRKRLRFEQAGLAIEVWMDKEDITQAELIHIAESLQ